MQYTIVSEKTVEVLITCVAYPIFFEKVEKIR